MKVVFTHGYFIHEDAKEQAIMRPYPPLGLLYLSAWLEKHGVDNDVFDTTFSTKEKLFSFLLEKQPDIIPIYTNLMTKVNVVKIVQFVRAQDTLKNAVIVIGGPDVTYNIENYLNTGADILVIGEGEQTMLEITMSVASGNKDYGHITGVAYRNSEGDIIKTAGRQKIKDVDQLPFPNRKKIDLPKYLNAWKEKHGQNAVSVSTQRGCPYTCKWCSTAVYGQSYRRRSPKHVVDELLHIKEQYDPDTLWFVDDVFTVSHKWLAAFRDEVVSRNAIIPFECITRADRMNEDVIEMLKEAGAFRVWIGAESGSQRIIDAMDRRVEVGKVREMIQKTRLQGIQAGTFIMLGYPGETAEDIEETIHHLKTSNPDHFTITIAYPIKGTGLYDQIEDVRTTFPDWNTSTDRDIDFKRTYPKRYYEYALRRVINEVNYHKKLLDKKQLSLPAMKMKIKSVAAKVGMDFIRKYANSKTEKA